MLLTPQCTGYGVSKQCFKGNVVKRIVATVLGTEHGFEHSIQVGPQDSS